MCGVQVVVDEDDPIPSPCIPCEIRFALSRPLRFAKGRISPPLPSLPADAGIQGHKNNRLPRSRFGERGAGPRPREMRGERRALSDRLYAHPLPVHPLRNSLRSFASPSLREGEDFSATPVIPADAGIQRHKNNRLPRAALVGPVRVRGSGVVCFTLGSRVRGNDVAVAGMTWLSPE